MPLPGTLVSEQRTGHSFWLNTVSIGTCLWESGGFPSTPLTDHHDGRMKRKDGEGISPSPFMIWVSPSASPIPQLRGASQGLYADCRGCLTLLNTEHQLVFVSRHRSLSDTSACHSCPRSDFSASIALIPSLVPSSTK